MRFGNISFIRHQNGWYEKAIRLSLWLVKYILWGLEAGAFKPRGKAFISFSWQPRLTRSASKGRIRESLICHNYLWFDVLHPCVASMCYTQQHDFWNARPLLALQVSLGWRARSTNHHFHECKNDRTKMGVAGEIHRHPGGLGIGLIHALWN